MVALAYVGSRRLLLHPARIRKVFVFTSDTPLPLTPSDGYVRLRGAGLTECPTDLLQKLRSVP